MPINSIEDDVPDDITWGIAGTGRIATSFAQALERADDAALLAVCSRTSDRATAFAAEHGVERAYGSLDAMLGDPDLDVVYVASPHSEHRRQALAAIAAGKHVLVEKPFAMSAAEARQVFDAADAAGTFVMEALWTRFLPAHVRLRELVAQGVVGQVQAVEASLGWRFPHDPSSRLFDPTLGGGALMDLAIYPINTAVQLLGPPDDVVATGHLDGTGIDLSSAVAMHFPGGAIATAQCSLVTLLPGTARIMGAEAWIELPFPHHAATSLTIRRRPERDRPPIDEVIDLAADGVGLHHQVFEVHRCLRGGATQSSTMSWAHTLELMTILDAARTAIGIDG